LIIQESIDINKVFKQKKLILNRFPKIYNKMIKMSDINQLLENKLNEVKNLIQTKSHKGIIKVFREVIDKVDDITLFYDFVGNTFATDPTYFNEKFLDFYLIYITELLNFDQILEMETQILQKFSLYQDEKITAKFLGHIELGAGKMVGRIYLTTLRIIAIGKNKSKSGPWVTQSFVGVIMDQTIKKSIVRNLQTKLNQVISPELHCLGYQYPMFGLQKIKLSSKTVNYKVLLETTLPSGSISRKNYRFRIVPYGVDSSELAKLVHDTIIETSKRFT